MHQSRAVAFLFSLVLLLVGSAEAFSFEDLVDLHSSFLSTEQLESFKRMLRGCPGRHGHHGQHHSGHHGCGGELTDDEHETIMYLFDNRHVVDRDVDHEALPNGVETTTTSTERAVAEKIQEHVYSMTHLGERRVRTCDPLFRDLFDHKESTEIEVEYLNDDSGNAVGVLVKNMGKDECGDLLVQAHADTVTRFVETGMMMPNFDWVTPDVCVNNPDNDESVFQ